MTGQLAEKRMFGGLCFLLGGKMCCGVLGDDLVIRLDPGLADRLLERKHVRPMDFTGKAMRGYLYVRPQAIRSEVELLGYLGHAIDFVRSLVKDEPRKTTRDRRLRR